MWGYTNYFRPGTTWIIESWVIGGNGNPGLWIHNWVLEEEEEVDGEVVMPMYFYQEHDDWENRKLTYYIRTEDNKVYWRFANPEFPEWYLMYDFGMQPGDELTLTWMYMYQAWSKKKVNKEGSPFWFGNLTCKAILPQPEWDTYEIKLDSEIYEDPALNLPSSQFTRSEQGSWIAGIGNIRGVTDNILYHNYGFSYIAEVYSFGRLVYATEVKLGERDKKIREEKYKKFKSRRGR